MKRFSTLWLVSVGLMAVLNAAEPLKFEVKKDNLPDSKLFPEIQTEARRLDKLVVDAIKELEAKGVPTRDDVEKRFPAATREFGIFVRGDAMKRLQAGDFDKLPTMLDYFAGAFLASDGFPRQLPELIVNRDGFTVLQYRFSGDPAETVGQITLNGAPINVATANGPQAVTRETAIESLRDAIAPYKLNAASFTAHETHVQLLALAEDWDRYFEQGRPQTFADICVTTVMERRHFQTDHLVGPPSRQWFVLHPNVVIENVNAAPDGSQLKGAIAMEWFGVNWWNLKVPLGISLCSLYSDRKDVDDLGHGVMVYVANKFCLGWVNHGGDQGFFVSMDLLRLVDSKKSKLDAFRSQLSKFKK